MILYDQRGSGKSLPLLSLENNTTQSNVSDIGKLMDVFGVGKVTLFGASWGSTLALLFAIDHPERVERMVLSGVFLASESEWRRFVDGSVAKRFPEAWSRFISVVPADRHEDIAAYYLERLQGGTPEERESFALHWAMYDVAISGGMVSLDEQERIARSLSYRSLALYTAYYILNRFFLADGFIEERLDRLRDVPITIVQGRDDVVTDYRVAERIHSSFPISKLRTVDGGHSGPGLYDEIRKAIIDT